MSDTTVIDDYKIRKLYNVRKQTAKVKRKISSFINDNRISKKIENFKAGLKSEIYSRYDYDEKTTNDIVNKFFIKVISIDVAIFIASILIYGFGLYQIAISIFVMYIVDREMLKKSFKDEHLKILYELPDLIDEIKSSYYEKKMVVEALYEAANNMPKDMSTKVLKMASVLESANLKVEVEKYQRECNNRFLKLLINILFFAKEYGDKQLENENDSLLIKNLNNLLDEVNIEITKQNLFKVKFAGLLFTSMFPLVFINFIENWSVSNFEQLSTFYNSYAGFILKNVSVFATILISLLVIKIKESENNYEIEKNIIRRKESPQNYTLSIINKVDLKRLIPNKDSKEYKMLADKLERNYLEISPDNYYSAKIKTALLSFAIIITILLEANRYLTSVTSKVLMLEVVIAALLSILFTVSIDIKLLFEKKLKKTDAINEINSFRCIISMIINYSFASCEEVLRYLEKYSKIFKNSIRKCLNDFENGSEYALCVMKEEVKEKGFKKIIRALIQCSRNIKIKEAFSYLESERDFYREEKKNQNAQTVNEKTNLAQMLSLIPYYVLMVLYFITPMVVTGIQEIGEMLEQIKNI